MLTRAAHVLTRYRWYVIGAWIALTVFGAFAASQLSSRWYTATAIPGQPAYEASQRALHELGVGDRVPDVVVFHADGDITQSTAVEQAMRRAAAAVPGSFTSSYFTTRSTLYVSDDKHTAFQMLYQPGRAAVDVLSGAKTIRTAAATGLPAGITVNVTGRDALDEATKDAKGQGSSVLFEAVIGGLGALLILLFVFGTLPAVLAPIGIAVAAVVIEILKSGFSFRQPSQMQLCNRLSDVALDRRR